MQNRHNSGRMAGRHTAAGLVLVLGAGATHAAQLEEVVVTAQKREQSLQDVPIAVTAVFPDEVRDYLGAGENIRALSGRVPGLVIESSNGRQSPRFYIRGLGNTDFDVNANQPVGFVYDDVFLENAILKSIPVFDIERIEVLKGPQGTLFGRNTPAGLVKVDSVKPSFEPDGYALAGYGSRNTNTFEVAVGGGITEQVAGRVSLKYLGRGDWIDNRATNGSFGGFDEFAYRGQLLWQPNESFSALIKAHGFQQEGNIAQPFYANALEVGSDGVRPGFDPTEVTQDSRSFGELDHHGAMLNLEYTLDNGMTITSITSYDSVEGFTRGDVDGGIIGGPATIGVLGFNADRGVETGDGLSDHRQIQQELRLSQEVGRFFYQAGLFYFNEKITVDNNEYTVPGSAFLSLTQNDQDTRSIAVFGQADYAVTDRITVTAGLRYTDDDKELEVIPGPGSAAPPDTISLSDSYVNWNLAANFDFSEDVSLYARVGNASRGPVTIGRFGFTGSADTETLLSYEGGFKARLFDDRVRWNTSVFYYDIEDQQLTATGGEANTNTLLNAAETIGKGFETELSFLATERLRFNMNASYTDTEINDANLRDDLCGSRPSCTGLDPVVGTRAGAFGPVTEVSIDGNPLPRAPKWLFNFDATYEHPVYFGTVYAQTDWNYRGDSNIFFHESVEFVADARWLGGVRVGVRSPSERLDVAFVGRNITNEIAVDGALNFLNLTAFTNEPRFFGFEVRYDFF